MLVPANRLPVALVLEMLCWGQLSWPPGLQLWQCKPPGYGSLTLTSHSAFSLMELKSSAWLPQARHCHQGMALVCETIPTLNITHGGRRSSSPVPTLPALASRSQTTSIPSASSQPEPSLPKPASAPARALHPQALWPRSGTALPCACGVNHRAAASHCGRPGQVSLAASCEGANFIYAGYLQHSHWDCWVAAREWGALLWAGGEPRECREREAPLPTGAMGKLEASLSDACPVPAAWRGARVCFQKPHQWCHPKPGVSSVSLTQTDSSESQWWVL